MGEKVKITGESGGSLLVSYALATRGLRRPSLGILARPDVPVVGGRVITLRAIGDQTDRPLEKRKSEVESMEMEENG